MAGVNVPRRHNDRAERAGPDRSLAAKNGQKLDDQGTLHSALRCRKRRSDEWPRCNFFRTHLKFESVSR